MIQQLLNGAKLNQFLTFDSLFRVANNQILKCENGLVTIVLDEDANINLTNWNLNITNRIDIYMKLVKFSADPKYVWGVRQELLA